MYLLFNSFRFNFFYSFFTRSKIFKIIIPKKKTITFYDIENIGEFFYLQVSFNMKRFRITIERIRYSEIFTLFST